MQQNKNKKSCRREKNLSKDQKKMKNEKLRKFLKPKRKVGKN